MRWVCLWFFVLVLIPLSGVEGQCLEFPFSLFPKLPEHNYRSLVEELPDVDNTTVFGDASGKRKALAEEGILYGINLTQMGQGSIYGGQDTNNAISYFGHSDYTLRLDLARMNLWEGGLITIRGESAFGHSLNNKVGTLLPLNFEAIEPSREDESETALSEWFYAQALSEKFVLVLGKVDIIGGRDNIILGSRERERFWNTGMRLTPMIAPFVPYTPLAVAGVWLPTKWLRFSTAFMDNEQGTNATTTGFNTAFHGKMQYTLAHDTTATVKPFGREGHQSVGFLWMGSNYRMLEDVTTAGSLEDLVRPAILWEGYDVARKAGVPPFRHYRDAFHDWMAYYQFDQFLYQKPDDPRQGWGLQGRTGFNNSPSNPLEGFYFLGVGGRGLVPRRSNDAWGIGYYHANLNDRVPNILKVHSEQAVEVFYNFELRRGVQLTPDIQIIFDPGGGRQPRDVAVVYGLRLQMEF